jgi:hypothetical protein
MVKLVIHKSVLAVKGERKEILQPGLRSMAGNNNIEKLIKLVRWALGLKDEDYLPKFTGGFDEVTGAFWFSFDKDTYFQRGGREVIRDLLAVFNSQGWPMVSIWGSDYWSGAFPRKVAVADEVEETIKEVPQTKVERPKTEFKPKVVRTRRERKIRPIGPTVEVEEEE